MTPRKALLRSLAKINLDLRVLYRHPDGFHELRTVFQTISLADSITVEYESARRTELLIEDELQIADNLILRAASALLDEMRVKARVRFELVKQIPMGGGLGGGSSNAAAVLLALPVLAGRKVPLERLHQLGAQLGSDVPFFLEGGCMAGVGRGTELYPLPDLLTEPVWVVNSGVHVATGPAYQALGRGPASDRLTFNSLSSRINGFQAFVRTLVESRSAVRTNRLSANDFEAVVFPQYPQLQALARRLRGPGARMTGSGACMTGSGSALFSFQQPQGQFAGCSILAAKLVNRRGYQQMWRRQLREHIDPSNPVWPPQSQYAR